MTATPTPTGLAGTGPWYAVLAWRDGQVLADPDDIDNIDEPADCSIGIVRGSALPRDEDGSLRMPYSWTPGDLLLEIDGEDLDSCDELLERWQQVQAMVDGLNRAATGSPQRAQGPEQLARLFHDTYETLAPEFGYRTRQASAKPWEDVPEQNRALMVATCARVLDALPAPEPAELPTDGLLGVGAALSYAADRAAGRSCTDPEYIGWFLGALSAAGYRVVPGQQSPADRPSVPAAGPTTRGEGDGQGAAPPDAQEAAEPLDLSTADAPTDAGCPACGRLHFPWCPPHGGPQADGTWSQVAAEPEDESRRGPDPSDPREPATAQEPVAVALAYPQMPTIAPPQPEGYPTRHASPHCACGYNGVDWYVDSICIATTTQGLPAGRRGVAADSPPVPGEGDGHVPPPADALRAAQAVIATHRWDGDVTTGDEYAVACACGWRGPRRWREHIAEADYAQHAAYLVLETVWPYLAARALREYADRHHAHPGGPTGLIQTLTIREAGGAILDYDACRSCSARLDEHGQCTGERPRLLLAAQRIAAGEPDPADPPRPGTEWTPEPVVREADRG